MPEATQVEPATDVAAETEAVARAYFAAVAARDLDAMTAFWAPGGAGRFIGDRDLTVPEGFRRHFGQIFRAFPDFDLQVTDLSVDGERATVRWRARGTF